MASDFEKPNKVHTLYIDEIEEKLRPLPIGDLFWCWRKTEPVLKKMWINTIWDLAKTDKAIIKAKIGSYWTRPSAFIDLIHSLQLALTGADISFAAPLSYDAQIKAGDVYVNDMFNLYKYENMLYTMDLTGREILGALEYSYGIWINQMKSKNDHVLLMNTAQENAGDGFNKFLHPMFNFDSAAGIIYTVDATKPAGQKVKIESMADGTPFDLDKHYKVAVNSYRGNGGGEHLTKGAGIAHDDLIKRVIVSTDKDLRYYLMEYIEQHPDVNPQPLNQWKLIPEEWTKPAIERDYKALFGNK